MSTPVWQQSTDQYQHESGVHRPYIAEISPWQYSTLSKRGKAQYDERRRHEWDASDNVRSAWATAVINAYEAGQFDPKDPGVSNDAKTTIFWHNERKAKTDLAARMLIGRRANQITELTPLQVGDRVFTLMGGFYTTITKLNRKSARIQSRYKGTNTGYSEADYTTDKGNLNWLSYNDLEAAVAANAPIGPQRDA